jgi:hypothetical protein
MGETTKAFRHLSEIRQNVQKIDELPLSNSIKAAAIAFICDILRINHDIEIEVSKDRTVKWSNDYYNYCIIKSDVLIHQTQISGTVANSPNEAYLAAFDYILNNNLV